MNTPLSSRLSLLSSLAAMLVILWSNSYANAATTIRHPGDGFATIQAAVEAAGCDGTVLVATGVYNEQVVAPCGIHLIGEGIDQTILDGTGLDFSDRPALVVLGNSPFSQFPTSGPYELANLTVRVAPSNIFRIGVFVGWTRKAVLHDVSIEGFAAGIDIELSSDTDIHDVRIQGTEGLGLLSFDCIAFRERDLFRGLLPKGHMSGHVVSGNLLSGCNLGIRVENTTDVAIHHNDIVNSSFGAVLSGVERAEFQRNFIPTSRASIFVQNLNDSTIHHNTLCQPRLSPAIIFVSSGTPDLFDFPPSSHNTLHHNTFGPGFGSYFFSDPHLGPGNLAHDNEFANPCPPE